MSSIVYLNGQYMPVEEAKISVLDRGFTFGDGIYEVILVHNDHPFRLDEHIIRLNKNLDQIYIDHPHTLQQWQSIVDKLIESNSGQDRSLYIQITRGCSKREHAINSTDNPTVFAMINPLLKQDHSMGVSAIIEEDIRWQYCHIKAITLLPSILLRHKAKQAGAAEAILVRDGYVTEGAASNVFIVQDYMIKTPDDSHSLLPGITKELVVDLLYKSDINFAEMPITEAELRQADEVWLTSTTWEITPVIKLNSNLVGSGKPGKFWQQTFALYQQFKNS